MSTGSPISRFAAQQRRHEDQENVPDNKAAPNQPTVMDVAQLSRQPKDIASGEDQLIEGSTVVEQLEDAERVSHSRSDNESDQNKQPDFTTLPDFIWAKIFSELSQRDRLSLSVTCRMLHDVCMNCSVLWRSAYIQIGDNRQHYEKVQLQFNTADNTVLQAHCHQMQNLVIQINLLWNLSISESSLLLLNEAAEKFPLKHLEVRSEPGYEHYVLVLGEQLLDVLRTCITSPNASELCFLGLPAFDWVTDGKSGILDALENSSFTSSLTHLYLEMLTENCSDDLCKALRRFPNLQFLTVPFVHISNNLLNSFPKQLNEVDFIVYVQDCPKAVTNWPQVLASLPQLTVGLTIVGDHFTGDIPHLLPSLVPVSSIRIHGVLRSDCCFALHSSLLQLLPKSFSWLKALYCRYSACEEVDGLPDDYIMDDTLIATVSQCPNLDQLGYSGSIRSDAVLTLAALRPWTELQFNAAFVFFKDSNDREKELLTLCEKVSMTLGKKWKLQSPNEPPIDVCFSGIGLYFQPLSPA